MKERRFDKIGNTQVQFSTYNLIPTQRSPRWLGVSSLRPRADQSPAAGAFSLVDLMAGLKVRYGVVILSQII